MIISMSRLLNEPVGRFRTKSFDVIIQRGSKHENRVMNIRELDPTPSRSGISLMMVDGAEETLSPCVTSVFFVDSLSRVKSYK